MPSQRSTGACPGCSEPHPRQRTTRPIASRAVAVAAHMEKFHLPRRAIPDPANFAAILPHRTGTARHSLQHARQGTASQALFLIHSPLLQIRDVAYVAGAAVMLAEEQRDVGAAARADVARVTARKAHRTGAGAVTAMFVEGIVCWRCNLHQSCPGGEWRSVVRD